MTNVTTKVSARSRQHRQARVGSDQRVSLPAQTALVRFTRHPSSPSLGGAVTIYPRPFIRCRFSGSVVSLQSRVSRDHVDFDVTDADLVLRNRFPATRGYRDGKPSSISLILVASLRMDSGPALERSLSPENARVLFDPDRWLPGASTSPRDASIVSVAARTPPRRGWRTVRRRDTRDTRGAARRQSFHRHADAGFTPGDPVHIAAEIRIRPADPLDRHAERTKLRSPIQLDAFEIFRTPVPDHHGMLDATGR